jgi:hypothetical protein
MPGSPASAAEAGDLPMRRTSHNTSRRRGRPMEAAAAARDLTKRRAMGIVAGDTARRRSFR